MSKDRPAAPYAFDGLDRLFHEKARLGILTSLVSHPKGLSFGDLKQLCDLTDGNLSRHLQILQDARMVDVQKSFVANRPHTTCRLTDEGRARFADYLTVLEQVLKNAAPAPSDTVPSGLPPKLKPAS